MIFRTKLITRPIAAAALATAVWACASSGGGISGTSLVFGSITQFGSIVVNDVRFDTANATVTIEGDPADVSDLQLGMVVLIRGRANRRTMTGTADRIATDHLLQGPVEGVNVGDGTFAALSQLVITDASTVFAQTTIGTLAAGENVEVFGYGDADGSIRATRVERKPVIPEIDLTGTIADLNTTDMTFRIGLLTVDYSDALLEIEPEPMLSNGLLVEVEATEPPVADRLMALGVERRPPDFAGEDADSVEIEGFVTQVVASDEFVLNTGQRVTTTLATAFENGTAGDLVINARVEVEGSLSPQGTLIADEVEFVTTP